MARRPDRQGFEKDGRPHIRLRVVIACTFVGALLLLAQAPLPGTAGRGEGSAAAGGLAAAAARRLQEAEAHAAEPAAEHAAEPEPEAHAEHAAEPGLEAAPAAHGLSAEGAEGEEAHGEHGGHGEHGHHEPDAKESGLSFSVICIAMIALIFFAFLNSEDADIVAYTWDLLAKGTNVFVSVMLFLVVVEICHHIWPENSWLYCTAVMGVTLILLTFVNLHVTRGQMSTPAIGKKKQRYLGAVDYSKITKRAVVSMTFGAIQAHLAAFTMILFWAHVQLWVVAQPWSHGSPYLVAFVGVVAFFFHLGVMAFMKSLRAGFAGVDGHVDEDEHFWLHKSQEVDIEAGGLECSFLAMEAIRFFISGVMPDAWGAYHGRVPTMREDWWLLGTAVAMGILSMFLRRQLAIQRARVGGVKVPETEEEEEEEEEQREAGEGAGPFLEGLFSAWELLVDTCSFLCGWSFFFFFEGLMKYWDAKSAEADHEQDIMLIRTMVALMISAVVFMIICCMDKILDFMTEARMNVSREAQIIITVVGMMMGFAWERCFHHAFEVSAEGAVVVLHKKLGLDVMFSELGVFVFTCAAMGTCTILVMYWYINPRALESRAKARFEKLHPDGAVHEELPEELEESAVGKGADFEPAQPAKPVRGPRQEAGGGRSFFGDLLGRRKPSTRAVVMQSDEEERARAREARRDARVVEDDLQDYERPRATRPLISREVDQEEEEDVPVPFPMQRRSPDEYPYYGQAPWAQSGPWASRGPPPPPPGAFGPPPPPWGGPPPPGAWGGMPPQGAWPPPGAYGPPQPGWGAPLWGA